jgi:hypothetical protein
MLTNTAAAAGNLSLNWQATAATPLVDPALVIHNWGESTARLRIDGHVVPWGKTARVGYVHHLEGTDLVLWIERQSNAPMQVELLPAP